MYTVTPEHPIRVNLKGEFTFAIDRQLLVFQETLLIPATLKLIDLLPDIVLDLGIRYGTFRPLTFYYHYLEFRCESGDSVLITTWQEPDYRLGAHYQSVSLDERGIKTLTDVILISSTAIL